MDIEVYGESRGVERPCPQSDPRVGDVILRLDVSLGRFRKVCMYACTCRLSVVIGGGVSIIFGVESEFGAALCLYAHTSNALASLRLT